MRLAQRGIVLLVCLSLGMHWALLQGIAWTGMLISFASEGAVIEAVQKTFDGQHGCPLCAKVKEGRDSDQKQPQQTGQSLKKMDAILVTITKLIAPAAEGNVLCDDSRMQRETKRKTGDATATTRAGLKT